jgi:prepilin-type N-terminal cleavage/methylation domain-containing protein
MSILSNLLAMSRAELKTRLQAIDTSAVKGRALKRKFENVRKKEGGFTLLELLVVVAILAAIAGTATIMLQDTDRKGAAAAHVAIMDELSKGIQTFRVLNQGAYPDIWDSLYANSANETTGADKLAIISDDLDGNLEFGDALTAADLAALNNAGIHRVRVVDTGATLPATYTGVGTCDNSTGDTGIGGLIRDKGNDFTPQNIFKIVAANGCGFDDHYQLEVGSLVATWKGDPQRVGVPNDTAAALPDYKLVAFGVGPDSTLFNPSIIGALSNVPVYRHVANDEYNRFIVLFNTNPAVEVYDPDSNTSTFRAGSGQASFQAIIDGAGDTKDEELGEVDNVRPT